MFDGRRSSRTVAMAGVDVDPLHPFLTVIVRLPPDRGKEHLGQSGDQTSTRMRSIFLSDIVLIDVPRLLQMRINSSSGDGRDRDQVAKFDLQKRVEWDTP